LIPLLRDKQKRVKLVILLICPVQPHFKKYSHSRLTQITSISLAVPPPTRGVSRSSRTRGGMWWTRQHRARGVMVAGRVSRERSQRELTNGACRGRRSRVVLTPRRWRQVCGGMPALPGAGMPYPQTTVTTKPDHRGARRKPLKPSRAGMPGESGCTCGGYTRVPPTLCARGCGCGGHIRLSNFTKPATIPFA
jgi:hypothetical protein